MMHGRIGRIDAVAASRLSEFPAVVVIGLAAGFLLLLRVPDVFLHPQFWAEDAGIFFQQQKIMGASAIVQPYAGYLHLVPRLTALLASPFPSRDAPAIYDTSALVFTMWSAATIANARYDIAWLGGLLLVAVPHWWGEVLGTITNIQWLMAPALAMIVATPSPARLPSRANQLAFTVCASLSGPFSILALPLCAARLWTSRDRHSLQLVAIVAASALIQFTVAITSYVHSVGESAPLAEAMTLFDRWFGTLASGDLTHSFPQFKAALFLVVAYAVSLVLLRDRVHVALLVFSLLVMVATWLKYLHGYPGYLARGWYADRYFYIPHFAVLFAIACAVLSVRLPTYARMAAAAALALIVTSMHDTRRSRLTPLPWAEQADRLDAGEAVAIPTNPVGAWTVVIPAALK